MQPPAPVATASTAAKASYTPMASHSVLTPPPVVATKKDPKLANNWKTKPAEELTDAEDRFAARLGRDIGMQLAAAWRGKLELEPELDCMTCDPAKLAAVRADDELFVQRFKLRGAPFEGRTLLCAYPVAALRGIADDEILPETQGAGGADPAWAGALDKALRDVRMPVRSVLARPEISLVKLLALEVGDIIPLAMPRHVPVTVAGRSFALGSIGEANGNAAIMIDHIEKGPDHD